MTRKVKPTIGGQGGIGTSLSNMLKKFKGKGGTIPPTGGGGGAAGAIKTGATLADDLGGAGAAGGLRGLLGSGVGKTLLGAGKRAPIIGSMIGVAADRVVNPEHSWGRSLARGVGGAVGGLLGLGAAGLLGVGTGGVGLLAGGALTVGGGMAGEKAGDWLYSKLAGDSDVRPVNQGTQPVAATATTTAVPTAVNSLNVGKLNVNDKDFDGKIDGMTPDGEEKTKNSLGDFFRDLFTRDEGSTVNLSYDQRRG
jgi:hypothetical protein